MWSKLPSWEVYKIDELGIYRVTTWGGDGWVVCVVDGVGGWCGWIVWVCVVGWVGGYVWLDGWVVWVDGGWMVYGLSGMKFRMELLPTVLPHDQGTGMVSYAISVGEQTKILLLLPLD